MDKPRVAAAPEPAAEGRKGYRETDQETGVVEVVGSDEGAYAMANDPQAGLAHGREARSEGAAEAGPPVAAGSGKKKGQGWRRRLSLWKRRFNDRTILIVTTAALLQALVSIAIEIAISYRHKGFRERYEVNVVGPSAEYVKANSSALVVYYGMFCAGQLFYILLLLASIINGSFVEYVSSIVVSGILLIYSFVQLFQTYEVARAIISSTPGVDPNDTSIFTSSLSLFGTICAILFANTAVQGWYSRKTENAFGWRTFREFGADLNTKKRLKLYQVYTVLLKLSVVFFIGFDIQFLLLPSRKADRTSETGSTVASLPTTAHFIISLPVTICSILIAHYAQKKESRILMTITAIILQLGSIYLGIKIYDVIRPPEDNLNKYIGSKNSILFFEITALILAQITCYVGITNCVSFGKGLMSLVEKSNREATDLEDVPTPTYYYSNKSSSSAAGVRVNPVTP